jgi:hypothetical protein
MNDNNLIKDFFKFSSQQKYHYIKQIGLELYENNIDSTNDVTFSITLNILLEQLEEDIELAIERDDYEIAEIASVLQRIFNGLKMERDGRV